MAASQRKKLHRQQFPAGRDGQQLVLETHSPHGLAWRDLSVNPDPAFLTAHRSWTSFVMFGSMTAAGEYWKNDGDQTFGTPPNWTVSESSGWEAGGTSNGEFEYQAPFTRTFLVNWHMNFWYSCRSVYMGVMGGLFKYTAETASWDTDPVPGSVQLTGMAYDYSTVVGITTFFAYSKSLSGSAIVSMAEHDKLRLQYGWRINEGTNTAGAVALLTSGSSALDGMSVSVVPVT